HFHEAHHKLIFRAMAKANERGEFIDLISVTTHLGNSIEQVGGTSYILKMAESVASTANIKHHERLIFEAYRIRKSRQYVINYINAPDEGQLEVLISNLKDIRDVGTIRQEKTTYDYLMEI